MTQTADGSGPGGLDGDPGLSFPWGRSLVVQDSETLSPWLVVGSRWSPISPAKHLPRSFSGRGHRRTPLGACSSCCRATANWSCLGTTKSELRLLRTTWRLGREGAGEGAEPVTAAAVLHLLAPPVLQTVHGVHRTAPSHGLCLGHTPFLPSPNSRDHNSCLH